MKIITHDQWMQYSVGSNIMINLEKIKILGAMLLENVQEHHNVNLWCTGSSGAIMAAIVSDMLLSKVAMVRILHVKKQGEISHSGGNWPLTGNQYNVIIDDFIQTGSSILRVLEESGDVDCLAICGAYNTNWTEDRFIGYNFNTVICADKNRY